MLKWLFIFSFIFAQQICFAQKTINIKFPRSKILYAGGYNEVSYEFKGYSCRNLFVSTNNGTVRQEGICWFDFAPKDTGIAIIYINTKIKGKLELIKVDTFRVKDVDIKFFIGISNGGNIKKENIAAQHFVRAEAFELGCTNLYSCLVDSFNVEIFRDNCIIFQKWNSGNQINEEIRSFFSTLKDNDEIVISSIIGHNPITGRKLIKPVKFKIRN